MSEKLQPTGGFLRGAGVGGTVGLLQDGGTRLHERVGIGEAPLGTRRAL